MRYSQFIKSFDAFILKKSLRMHLQYFGKQQHIDSQSANRSTCERNVRVLIDIFIVIRTKHYFDHTAYGFSFGI